MTKQRPSDQFTSDIEVQPTAFRTINRAYNEVFRPGRLSIGLVVPIERYATSAEPTMQEHVKRAVQAEEFGFSALWLRDVPFNVPTFGDAGQMFDPFAYLGFLAARTENIALCVASVILPLRHPNFGIGDHTRLWQKLDAKRDGTPYGKQGDYKGSWVWFDNWIDRVREHCAENGDRYT